MNKKPLLIFLIPICWILFSIESCNNKPAAADAHINSQGKKAVTPSKLSFYEIVRNEWLKSTPEYLNLLPSDQKTIVYGVLLEQNLEGNLQAFVAYQTGYADICTERSRIYGKKPPQNIKDKAVKLVNKAQQYLDVTVKTEIRPSPGKDTLRLYLLTNKGLYFTEAPAKNFLEISPWGRYQKDISSVMRDIIYSSVDSL